MASQTKFFAVGDKVEGDLAGHWYVAAHLEDDAGASAPVESAEASDEDRAGLTEDIERDLSALEGEYQQLEIALTLGGPYDQRNSLVSIHARASSDTAPTPTVTAASVT